MNTQQKKALGRGRGPKLPVSNESQTTLPMNFDSANFEMDG